MAVAVIPKGFDRVASVREDNGGVEIVAESGEKVSTQIDLTFLEERHNEPPISCRLVVDGPQIAPICTD